MNLYEKIVEVMKRIQYLQKDDNVGVGNSSYKAISEEKVTIEVRKAMIELGIAIIPVDVVDKTTTYQYTETTTDKYGTTKTSDKFQRLCEVNTRYKLINTEKPEEFEIIASMGHGIDSQDKSSGKALTYAYKYALLRSFAIPTGEDPDKIHSNDIETPTPKDTPNSPKTNSNGTGGKSTPKVTENGSKGQINANEGQVLEINTLVTLVGGDHSKLLEHYKVDKYNDLTDKQATQIIDSLKKRCTEMNINYKGE